MRLSRSAIPLLLVLGGPALAASQAHFVSDAIKGDNSEIMLGQMAVQQAGSNGVKDFGRTLVSDHTQAKQQMSAVAQKIGVTPPDGVTDEAQQEQRKLSQMHGADFDREFVHYMVKDHETDIGKFRHEAQAGHGPANKMAEQQLPVLEKHLHMAETLEKSSEAAAQ